MTAQRARSNARRRFVRRWLGICTVMLLALFASTAAMGQSASGRALKGQVRPVVDATFLYNELYHLGTNFIYRVAGADGPLADPSDPNNLPQNYNGSQEFYKWFGDELTNPAADHMGPLGRFMMPIRRGSLNSTTRA